jgi:hypothetical protein
MPSLTDLPQRTAARLLLAAAAVGAGTLHLAAAGEHLQESRALGVAFVAAGAFQLAWGVLVAVRDSRLALLAGGSASIVFVGTYLLSRTSGLPVGSEAFEPEPLALAGVLCCALELPVAVGALLLARRPGALRRPLGRGWTVGLVAGLLLVGTAGGSALASPAHDHTARHEQGHEHTDACPTSPVLTGEVGSNGVDQGVTAYFRCRLLHEHDAAPHPHP